jgi:hypothetical protein
VGGALFTDHLDESDQFPPDGPTQTYSAARSTRAAAIEVVRIPAKATLFFLRESIASNRSESPFVKDDYGNPNAKVGANNLRLHAEEAAIRRP